jgi:hypothetical protein
MIVIAKAASYRPCIIQDNLASLKFVITNESEQKRTLSLDSQTPSYEHLALPFEFEEIT